MTYGEKYSLQNADCVETESRRIQLIRHYGAYFMINNEEFLIENVADVGVVKTSIADFEKKYPKIVKVRKFTGDEKARDEAYKRALNEIGKKFNWVTNNCEQFANYVQKGVHYSKQEFIIAGGVLSVGLILYFVFK